MRAAGTRCPREIAEFPSCLVAEAVGQLAAWVAMDKLDYRGRPVAALATETCVRGQRRARRSAGARRRHRRLRRRSQSPTAAGRRSTAGGSSSSGTAWVRCCRSRSSIRRRRCASASRCCAGEVRRPAAFAAWRRCRSDRRCARAGRVAARHADRARACGVLRRSLSRAVRCFRRRCCSTLQMRLAIELANSIGESRTGAAAMTPSRMTNVKMRTFITPGQRVEHQRRAAAGTR